MLRFAGENPARAFRFLSSGASGTLQTDFATSDAGQTAYYALRWLSTRGETGPWSEVAAATVAAQLLRTPRPAAARGETCEIAPA